MTASQVVTREEWLEARKALLTEEKAHARQSDALAKKRRALPRVRVDKDYTFDTQDGPRSLADLFGPHSQLIVQHFMFGPDYEAGCPMCSFWADSYNPMIEHMRHRDVSFIVCSRGPLERLQAYKQRMGWSFDWVSSLHSDFNFDYGVSATEQDKAEGQMTYNYRHGPSQMSELHGTSVFAKDEEGAVFHTYSTYGRGVDRFNGLYGFLDVLPKGRDEAGLPFSMSWVRRHDEYGN